MIKGWLKKSRIIVFFLVSQLRNIYTHTHICRGLYVIYVILFHRYMCRCALHVHQTCTSLNGKAQIIILQARGRPSWYFFRILLFSCKLQFTTSVGNVIISIECCLFVAICDATTDTTGRGAYQGFRRQGRRHGKVCFFWILISQIWCTAPWIDLNLIHVLCYLTDAAYYHLPASFMSAFVVVSLLVGGTLL